MSTRFSQAQVKTVNFLWPGYGDNLQRALEWIIERCKGHSRGRGDRHRTAAAAQGDGRDRRRRTRSSAIEAMAELLDGRCRRLEAAQLPQMHEHYAQFATKLQAELHQQLVDLEARLRD